MVAATVRRSAAAVVAELSVQWILLGTAKDMAIGETIAKTLGHSCVNRIGQTTLEQLIDELRECRLLRRMIPARCILFLCSVSRRSPSLVRPSLALPGPLGDRHIIVRHQVECSPCFLRECPIDFRCMKAVSIDEAIKCCLVDLASLRRRPDWVYKLIPGSQDVCRCFRRPSGMIVVCDCRNAA